MLFNLKEQFSKNYLSVTITCPDVAPNLYEILVYTKGDISFCVPLSKVIQSENNIRVGKG